MLHVQLPKLLLHLENYKVHHLLPSVQLQTLFTSPKSLHFCINLHPTSPKFPQDDFRNPIPTPLPVQPMQNLTTADERHFIAHVLAFFVASDGVVLENLAGLFMKEVQVAEARAFYGFQIAIENIHTEMYSLLLESYIKVSNEKSMVFRALETIPCVEKKANWAIRWIDGSESFAERVIAFS